MTSRFADPNLFLNAPDYTFHTQTITPEYEFTSVFTSSDPMKGDIGVYTPSSDLFQGIDTGYLASYGPLDGVGGTTDWTTSEFTGIVYVGDLMWGAASPSLLSTLASADVATGGDFEIWDRGDILTSFDSSDNTFDASILDRDIAFTSFETDLVGEINGNVGAMADFAFATNGTMVTAFTSEDNTFDQSMLDSDVGVLATTTGLVGEINEPIDGVTGIGGVSSLSKSSDEDEKSLWKPHATAWGAVIAKPEDLLGHPLFKKLADQMGMGALAELADGNPFGINHNAIAKNVGPIAVFSLKAPEAKSPTLFVGKPIYGGGPDGFKVGFGLVFTHNPATDIWQAGVGLTVVSKIKDNAISVLGFMNVRDILGDGKGGLDDGVYTVNVGLALNANEAISGVGWAVGSGLQMVPHPGVSRAGSAIVGASTALGELEKVASVYGGWGWSAKVTMKDGEIDSIDFGGRTFKTPQELFTALGYEVLGESVHNILTPAGGAPVETTGQNPSWYDNNNPANQGGWSIFRDLGSTWNSLWENNSIPINPVNPFNPFGSDSSGGTGSSAWGDALDTLQGVAGSDSFSDLYQADQWPASLFTTSEVRDAASNAFQELVEAGMHPSNALSAITQELTFSTGPDELVSSFQQLVDTIPTGN